MNETMISILKYAAMSGAILAVILIVRAVLGKRMGNAAFALLWGLFMLRLLLPFDIPSEASVYNAIPRDVRQDVYERYEYAQSEDIEHIEIAADTANAAEAGGEIQQTADAPVAATAAKAPDWLDIIVYVWLAGIGISVVVYTATNAAFWRHIRRHEQYSSPLVQVCSRALGIRWQVKAYVIHDIGSPAVFGMLRPVVILPHDMMDSMSQEENEYILMHELTHIKRRDNLVLFLMTLLKCVYWFNPFVWIAAHFIRKDMEYLTDRAVTGSMSMEKRKAYAATLVKVVDIAQKTPRLSLAAASNKKDLKQRISDILASKKQKRVYTAVAVALAIVLCIVGCTNTTQGETGTDLMDDTQQSKASAFFPNADEIFVHSYGGTTEFADIGETIDVLNQHVLDNQHTANMAVREEDINRIKSGAVCVEVVYNTPVQAGRWQGVNRFLIALSDNGGGDAGLLFFAKDGVYQDGPKLAFDEAGIASLIEHFGIKPSPVDMPFADKFRRIEEWFDAGDLKQTIIEYQSKLQPSISNGNYQAIFYQLVPLEDGELVMAEFRGDGETHPELYYIKDGKVQCSTVYSDTWGLNYTVLNGHTILFGRPELVISNAVQPIDESDLTGSYDVTAGFNYGIQEADDGNADFVLQAKDTVAVQNAQQSYILIKQGLLEFPQTFTVTNSNGKTLLDINYPMYYAGKCEGPIDYAQMNYCPMTTPESISQRITINVEGTQEHLYFAQMQEELPESYLWVNYNNRRDYIAARYEPGQKFSITDEENLQAYEYFWLDLRTSGVNSTIDDLLIMTGREMPDKPGDYMLVFNTDRGHYTLVVRVVE